MVSDSLDDIELERLLTQLLRVVSPAATVEAVEAGSAPVPGVPVPDPPVPGLGDGTLPGAAVPRPDGAPVAGVAVSGPDGAAVPGATAPGQGANGQPGNGAGIPSVSASEARALIELVAARGIAQGELASLLGLEKSTVSRLAAGLERKGWVRRGRDEDNQRYVRLYLTPEGTAMAGQVWRAWHSRQARILAALSEEERSGLSAGLRGLVRGLAAEGLLSDAAPG